jgi:hypothetical protein
LLCCSLTLNHKTLKPSPPTPGALLLVLCVAIASAALAASFAVFPVRERRTGSRAAQAAAGARPSAFWAAALAWDLLHYSAPALGMLGAFALWNLPQFRGPRLWAVAALLGAFPLGALPMTYALQLLFEVRPSRRRPRRRPSPRAGVAGDRAASLPKFMPVTIRG